MLTKAEKENRVIELYEQGKNYRGIAQEVRMSLTNISSIVRRHTGELQAAEVQNVEQKLETTDTRAFKLFEEGKTPVKVAIELDLRSDEVTKLYTEYLKLKGLEELSLIYEERKDDLHEFHRAYKLTVDECVAPQRLIVAANHLQDIASLESRREVLKREVEGLENKGTEIYNSLDSAKQDLNTYNVSIKVHRQENTQLHNHKQQLQSVIAGLEQSEGYQRVQRIAEATARSILRDNEVILVAALRALLQTLSEEPSSHLQTIIYGSLSYPLYEPRNGNRPQNYIQLRQAVLLQSAEETYKDLLASAVKNTISSVMYMPSGTGYPSIRPDKRYQR